MVAQRRPRAPAAPDVGRGRESPGHAALAGLAALAILPCLAPAGLAATRAPTWGQPQPVRGCPSLPRIFATTTGHATEYHGTDGGLASLSVPGIRPARGRVRAEARSAAFCFRIPLVDRSTIGRGSMLVIDYHAADRVGWAKVELEARTDEGRTGFGWLGGMEGHGQTRIPLSPDALMTNDGVTVVVEVVVATFGGGATAVLDSVSLEDR